MTGGHLRTSAAVRILREGVWVRPRTRQWGGAVTRLFVNAHDVAAEREDTSSLVSCWPGFGRLATRNRPPTPRLQAVIRVESTRR